MSIFFTSDQHFYHNNIIKYCNRPFENVEEMNEEMIKRYNAVVGPDDTCIFLGDFGMCSVDKAKAILNSLNGKKGIVKGNHDPSITRCYRIGFDFVCLEMVLPIAGEIVRLNHYPYGMTWQKKLYFQLFKKLKPKKEKRSPRDNGLWLLHGHVHNNWGKVNGRQINISCDVWDYAPVPFATIERIIQRGKK